MRSPNPIQYRVQQRNASTIAIRFDNYVNVSLMLHDLTGNTPFKCLGDSICSNSNIENLRYLRCRVCVFSTNRFCSSMREVIGMFYPTCPVRALQTGVVVHFRRYEIALAKAHINKLNRRPETFQRCCCGRYRLLPRLPSTPLASICKRH